MKKIISSISAFTFISSLLFSCGDSAEKKTSENKPDKDTLTVEQKAEPEEKPVVSLTKKEAEARMNAFLKENRRKYDGEGEFDGIEIFSGNYNKDGALDYFFTVGFSGSDFVYHKHFFYNSVDDKIVELTINKTPEFLKSIRPTEISEGKFLGKLNFWNAYSYDLFAERDIKSEFTIEGNKIIFDKKELPKFKKAAKEITKELDQMQQEMMENADGVNSSEDADY